MLVLGLLTKQEDINLEDEKRIEELNYTVKKGKKIKIGNLTIDRDFLKMQEAYMDENGRIFNT